MKIVEADTGRGERVDGGGYVFGAVAAEIAKTDVIEDRDDDIGFPDALARPPA